MRHPAGGLTFVLLAGLATAAAAQAPARSDRERPDSAPPVTLRPLEITVTRSATAIDHVPLAISVLDVPRVRAGRLALGLDEILARVPGVIVSNRYNPAQDQQLSIRGFGARSAFGVRGLKVLLDGLPQTLPDGQGQLTNVDLSRVSRIEVLRGASSALYGNASGGVVSLWTDGARPSRIAPTVRSVGGAYGLFRWRIAGAVPLPAGQFSVSASRMTADGFRRHSRTDLRQLSFGLDQRVSGRTRMLVRGEMADNPVAQDPGALTLAEMNADPSGPNPGNLAAGAGKSVAQGQVGLTLLHDTPRGARIATTVFGLRRDLQNPLQFAYIDLGRWAYGLRATTTVPARLAGRTALLTAGGDAQWQRDQRINLTPARTTLTRDQDERVTELGPFVQASLEIAPRATLSAGVRYDRVTFRVDDRFLADGDDTGARVMAAWSGHAGLAVRAHPGLESYVTVGTSFETPTTTELANRPTGPGGFNPSLEPQHGTNLEVGARGRVGQYLSYEVAGFRTGVRGELIPFEVPGDPGRRFFRNAGSSSHQGLEMGVTLDPVAGLSLVAAWTWARHRFDEYRTAQDILDGKTIPGLPGHYVHWSAAYRSPWGLWAAFDNTHSSAYPLDDRNTVTNPGWWTSGVRAGWDGTVAGWRLQPFAGVLNLFNRRYPGSTQVNARFGRYYEPAPPRNAYLGLELSPAR